MDETRDGARSTSRLPIKVILPNQGKERRVPGGGSQPKPFRSVTPAYRESLHAQVSAIQRAVTPAIANRVGGMPLRVKVISNAIAKSHRPDRLFSKNTCSIVGAGSLGELFVKGTPDGLENLGRMIESDRTARVVKELSTVDAIEPITPAQRRLNAPPLDILRRSPRRRQGFLTRVKLFDYGHDQQRLLDDFIQSCGRIEAPVRQAGYAPRSFTFEVECRTTEQVESISRIVGVRSIGPMPVLRTVRPRVLNIQPLSGKLPTAADIIGDYPIVAGCGHRRYRQQPRTQFMDHRARIVRRSETPKSHTRNIRRRAHLLGVSAESEPKRNQ